MIDEAGLTKFIAKDGKEAMKETLKQLEGEHSHPDPLMMCNNALWSRGLEAFGFEVMGDVCPVCHANEHVPDLESGEKTGEFWMRTLVPHVRKMFEDRGLLNQN